MRIAFLVADFPKLSETFVINQVTGLLDRGHEVDIYSDHIEDWSVVHPDVNRYGLQGRTFLMPALPQNYLWRVLKGLWLGLTHFHKAPRLMVRSLNLWAYGEQALNLWLLYTAAALADRQPTYDIVHCQFGTQGYRGLAFKRLLQPTPKLLVMFRGHDISCYLNQGGERVYRRLFKHVDYCLANCNFFRQRVIELGLSPDKISVHFSGLDVSKFTYRPRQIEPDQPVRLATTGRLVEKKGIEYAIRAVAQQAKQSDLVYFIIGDGPLRQPLEALIHELDADDYVHLLGWQNESEIIQTLNTCHLFIAPSVTAADGNQDAPINVLKEAMAMGLPVVSTNHGGIPELVEEGISGFLVPERDADALAEKLSRLCSHPERWPEMGRAGRRFVESHYSLSHLNDRLVQIYQALLNNSEVPQAASIQDAKSNVATANGDFNYSLSSLE
ncbi:MAG: colanic acid biosynthesis glycosyltransferase WcaL [Leptolyngbya sp. SIO4C1]|nr:colanic acid biosynthesis glycosyltransferase WcaL [Leptolyngbya sp. SIO4C1]